MTLYRQKLLWLILFLITGTILVLLAFNAPPAHAAVDCTVERQIRVEVRNTDVRPPGLVETAGATVLISPDPLDGNGTLVIVDNGPFDTSPLTGRIETSACNGSYDFTLAFDSTGFACDVSHPNQSGGTRLGDLLITYDVDDCATASTPTPTPTATSTPTATPTIAPAPTATPQPPTVIIIQAPPPTATLAPTKSIISPPNTGDAGLR